MRLTGTPLLVVLAAVSVLLPALTVLLWQRVRGPRLLRSVARLGMVLASQLAAVLLVAAAANDYGYFYGSWAGLWAGIAQAAGASPGAVVVTTDNRPGVDPANPGGIRVTSDPRFSTPANWATRGRLETVQIRGPITGLQVLAHVFLPPAYFQHRWSRSVFPAAEVLTGYPGSNRQPVAKLKYQRVLLRDLHQHHAQPMVLVMMRSAVTYPRDAECTDVPGGPQVETFFAQDVPWEISRHYRVKPDAWGAIGDSTGGYCAAKITMTYPFIFHAAVSLSGYFTTVADSTTGDLWGGSPVVRNLNSPLWRLRHLPAPPISVLVTTSRDEGGPLGIRNSLAFIAAARAPMKVSSIVEPHGGHNFTTWLPELPKALSWLSARLPPAVGH